jgi:formylglycine-generating enzyme required for sulfatase activity
MGRFTKQEYPDKENRSKSRENQSMKGVTWVVAAVIVLAVLAGCGRETQDEPAAKARLVKTACGMEMVLIPAGVFTMGVNEGPIDAKPAHAVKVDSFLMDQSEITQEVYEKLTGKNPSRYKHQKNPVEQVTWADAVKFCNLRSAKEGLAPCYDAKTWECDFGASGYRLPTEAEWEYGCRAGTTNQFYFGDGVEQLRSHAWTDDNAQSKPHPVGHWQANPWGLYDMIGNVWEWCNDIYSAKYYRSSPMDNPRGPKEGEKRVLRGGAWSSKADNCTSWVRNCDEAGFSDVCLTMDSDGFRCVRKPSTSESAAGRSLAGAR